MQITSFWEACGMATKRAAIPVLYALLRTRGTRIVDAIYTSSPPILHISYKDHVTNEEVRAKIQQAIGPHEDLTIVKRTKLRWYGHVSHSSGLAKTILHGTVKGGRRQGRQRKGGKTTSGNGQAWSLASPRGRWRTGKNGENWLQNYLWCPNDPRG